MFASPYTYLSQIRPHIEHLVIVLNKIDTLESDERTLAEAFLSRILKENNEGEPPIFSLSARNAIRAIVSGDQSVLLQSGLPKLESYLIDFLAHEKQKTLVAAITHKASNLVWELRLETELILRALSLPLTDLEARIALFDQAAGQFEVERHMAQDQLNGDKKRILSELEEEAERLRGEAKKHFEVQVIAALEQEDEPESIRAALATAVPEFFKAELDRFAALFQSRLATTLSGHQHRTEKLIAQVRQTAADLMEIPGQVPESEEAFEQKQRPYWVLSGQVLTPNIIQPGTFDRFLPAANRKARLRSQLLQEVETLILHNVENLRWATRQNVEDAFRHFSCGLDEVIQISLEATRGAMAAVLERRQQQTEQVSTEIESRRFTLDGLKAIQERFQAL